MFSTKFIRPGVDDHYILGPTFKSTDALQVWLGELRLLGISERMAPQEGYKPFGTVIWQLFNAEGVMIATWKNDDYEEALS